MGEVVIVTGGAGYIGSHACKALHAAGFVPVTYDSLEHGHQEAVKWGPLEVGELENTAALDRLFDEYKPSAVMHFAAFAYVGESVLAPEKYYRNNVWGSMCLLDCMRKNGVAKLVFSSTCATYGVPETVPITEDHPQNPVNPYGFTKLAVERMITDYSHAHGLQYVILRYFNAAGADPDLEIGEDHDPEPHLIPNALRATNEAGEPLRVFGTDYDTQDGTCIRDYIHVSDLADAHVAALNLIQNPNTSGAYNLGTGRGYSVLDVIEAVSAVTGREVKSVRVDRRAGDPPVLIADSSRALKDLGWSPKYPSLEEIVASAWAWEQRRRQA